MIATIVFCAFLALCARLAEHVAARCVVPRRIVWSVAIALAAALPIAGALHVPHIDRPQLVSGDVTTSAPRPVDMPRKALMESSPRAGALAMRRETTERWERLARYARGTDVVLLSTWACASLLLLVQLTGSLIALRREAREWCEIVTDGLSVWLSTHAGPAVTGVVRLRIIMPRWLLDEDAATRTLLLRHEVEHVRAGDTRLLMAAAVVRIAFPWNAPVLWMIRRLQLAIEIDCDQRVVRSGGSVARYGLALVRVGERHVSPLPAAAFFLDSPIDLEHRIHALRGGRAKRPVVAAASMTAMVAVAIIVGAWMPWPDVGRTPSVPAVTVVTPHELPTSDVDPTTIAPDSAPIRAMTKMARGAAAQRVVVSANLPLTPTIDPAAAPRADDDSLPSLPVLREWIAQYHPTVVAGDPRVNRVTFVVDQAGRYVRSLADSIADPVSDSTNTIALRGLASGGKALRALARTTDPDPWRFIGVEQSQIANIEVARSRTAALAPYPLSVVLLQVRANP
jgi:hypothetical protein